MRKFRIGGVAVLCTVLAISAVRAQETFDHRGITYHVVPKNAIPALVLPAYVSTAQAKYLRDDDRIIVVHYANADLAYPTRVLDHHEIVNDLIDGHPLLVTYCPLCGSAAAFVPIIGDKPYVFGVSGSLYQSNLLMYDHETDSLWDQITGTAITGRMSGTRLKPYPVAYDTWKHWKAAFPQGRVLAIPERWSARFGDYDASPYLGYGSTADLWYYVSRLDTRLPNKTPVIGVEVLGAYKAYPQTQIATTQVVHDHVGDTPIALIVDRERSRVGAFDEERHRFSFNDGIIADERGQRWSWDGNALILGNEREESYGVVPTYWFAWGAIHPKTDIYRL